MLVKRCWNSKRGYTHKDFFGGKDTFIPEYIYTGWFLFGIIPVYIFRE